MGAWWHMLMCSTCIVGHALTGHSDPLVHLLPQPHHETVATRASRCLAGDEDAAAGRCHTPDDVCDGLCICGSTCTICRLQRGAAHLCLGCGLAFSCVGFLCGRGVGGPG